jgi:hypothetical protein
VGRVHEGRGLVETRAAEKSPEKAHLKIRARCIDKDCKAYNVEKSVALRTSTGYGTANGRVICPKCGALMLTLETYKGTGIVTPSEYLKIG